MLLLSWITLWIFFTGIFMIFFPWLNLFHSITKIPLENRKTTTNTNLESWQDGNEIKLFVDLEFWKYVKWISIVKSDFSPPFTTSVFQNDGTVKSLLWVKLLFLFFTELLQVFDFIYEPLFFIFCLCLFVYFSHFILMSDRIKV